MGLATCGSRELGLEMIVVVILERDDCSLGAVTECWISRGATNMMITISLDAESGGAGGIRMKPQFLPQGTQWMFVPFGKEKKEVCSIQYSRIGRRVKLEETSTWKMLYFSLVVFGTWDPFIIFLPLKWGKTLKGSEASYRRLSKLCQQTGV